MSNAIDSRSDDSRSEPGNPGSPRSVIRAEDWSRFEQEGERLLSLWGMRHGYDTSIDPTLLWHRARFYKGLRCVLLSLAGVAAMVVVLIGVWRPDPVRRSATVCLGSRIVSRDTSVREHAIQIHASPSGVHPGASPEIGEGLRHADGRAIVHSAVVQVAAARDALGLVESFDSASIDPRIHSWVSEYRGWAFTSGPRIVQADGMDSSLAGNRAWNFGRTSCPNRNCFPMISNLVVRFGKPVQVTTVAFDIRSPAIGSVGYIYADTFAVLPKGGYFGHFAFDVHVDTLWRHHEYAVNRIIDSLVFSVTDIGGASLLLDNLVVRVGSRRIDDSGNMARIHCSDSLTWQYDASRNQLEFHVRTQSDTMLFRMLDPYGALMESRVVTDTTIHHGFILVVDASRFIAGKKYSTEFRMGNNTQQVLLPFDGRP